MKNSTDWFKIENYKDAATLDAQGWYINLVWRCAEFNALEMGGFSDKVKASVAERASNPILKYNMFAVEWDAPLCAAVRSLTVTEIFALNEALQDKEQSRLRVEGYCRVASKAYKDGDNATGFKAADTATGLEHLFHGCGHVLVDLNASDEQIIHDFKEWLKTERQDSNFNDVLQKLFTRTNFDEWAKYGILPYLDLVIWQKATGTKLKQAVMGHLIFPDYDECNDPAERIRRTTKPKAESIIDVKGHTLRALKEQVIKEKNAFINRMKRH
jgi:hypothetical protein